MTPPAIPPSSSLVQPPMLERQRVNQPARSARSARSVRNGEGASSVQVRLDFGQPLKRQSAWEKAGDMLPKLNEYWSSEARGGGAGAGGLDSGCAPSREPEGDRTDGSSAKKAKTTHQKATSECAGQAEASRPQAGRQGRTEDVIVISDDEERIATAAGPAHSGVSGGEETETVAGTGSSLQSQTLTLPCARTPEPDDPPSGSAPLPPGPTLADNAGQGAATDGALGHDSDSESEDEPEAKWAKKYQARWMPSGGPQGGAARESPTSATIHDQPTARSGKDSKRVMSVVERRKELHEGKR